MKNNRSKSFIFFAGLLLSLSLVACSASGYSYNREKGVYETGAANYEVYDRSMAEMDEAAGMKEEGIGGLSVNPALDSRSLSGRKLITTGTISMETKSFDETLSAITKRVEELNGYLESSTVQQQDYYYNSYYYGSMPEESTERRIAELSARIPSDRYREFLETLRSVGKTTYFSEEKRDITLEYNDVELHKKSLLVEQERLLVLLESAQEVEDVFTIESRLSEIRYAIDAYESDLRLYDNQVDYSTIHISLYEVVTFTEKKTESLGTRIARRFQESLRSLKYFLTEALLDLIGILPFLVLAIIAFVILYLIIKALIRRDMKRKAKKLADKEKSPALSSGAFPHH